MTTTANAIDLKGYASISLAYRAAMKRVSALSRTGASADILAEARARRDNLAAALNPTA